MENYHIGKKTYVHLALILLIMLVQQRLQVPQNWRSYGQVFPRNPGSFALLTPKRALPPDGAPPFLIGKAPCALHFGPISAASPHFLGFPCSPKGAYYALACI